MPLDRNLLEKVTAASAALEEAERQVLVSRGEYHTAIRRLHLSGAPLREIAEAVSLSHQRVQQIVTASGGSWWRRAWSSRNAKRAAVCTWCGRPPSEVSKLVAGPNVFICDRCLENAERALKRVAGVSGDLRRARDGARDPCTFCSRRNTATRAVVTGPVANICSDCMRISRDFMSAPAG
jgi:hypothetical protein